jgi:hypothetical protein
LDLIEYDEMRLKIVEQNALGSTAKNPDNAVTALPTPGIVRLKMIDLISQLVRQHQTLTIHLDRLPPFLGNPLLQAGTKLPIKFQSQDAKPRGRLPAFFSSAASEILAPLPFANVLPEHAVGQEEQQLPFPRQSCALR